MTSLKQRLVFAAAALLLAVLLDPVTAFFTNTRALGSGLWRSRDVDDGKNTTSSALKKKKKERDSSTITFYGQASTTLRTPFPADATHPDKTLPNWMLSPAHSDPLFLGTNDYRPSSDNNKDDGGGLWDAFQPSVDWFGLEVVPVFRIRLDRCKIKRQVSATIQEARSDIRSSKKNGKSVTSNNVLQKMMVKSAFQGCNTVAWQEDLSDNNKGGWILKADLNLKLSIPLPSFLPIPPGFNAIGSRIVQTTCRKRLERNLSDLQEAYLKWARQQEVEEKTMLCSSKTTTTTTTTASGITSSRKRRYKVLCLPNSVKLPD